MQISRLREVCPVDCFYAGENCLLFTLTNVLIAVFVAGCPCEAIVPDTDDPQTWIELNKEFAEKWPNITVKGDEPPDADNYSGESGKYEKYFSAAPGKV